MMESLIARLFAVFLVLALMTGCAGYQIGTRSLYRNNIRTIHVPIIKCDSFRPELGVYLTEAVQKEIEQRTPYKLTNIETADSIMICFCRLEKPRITLPKMSPWFRKLDSPSQPRTNAPSNDSQITSSIRWNCGGRAVPLA